MLHRFCCLDKVPEYSPFTLCQTLLLNLEMESRAAVSKGSEPERERKGGKEGNRKYNVSIYVHVFTHADVVHGYISLVMPVRHM